MSIWGKLAMGAALVASGVVAYVWYKYENDPKTRAELNCKTAWHELLADTEDKVVWGKFAVWVQGQGSEYNIFVSLENKLGFAIEPGTCTYDMNTGQLQVTRPPA